MNQPTSKPKRFHNVMGLSTAEYKTLRDEMLHPRVYFPVLNRTDVKRSLCSALYFSALMPKLEHVVRVATSGLRAFETPKAKALVTKLFTSLETRDLYLFRDTPSKYPKVWTRNKARLALKVDSALMKVATAEFPDDAEVLARCAACGAKWLQRRLPGVDKRLKPGPKTGRRKRLHKRKENDNAKHDESIRGLRPQRAHGDDGRLRPQSGVESPLQASQRVRHVGLRRRPLRSKSHKGSETMNERRSS